MAKDTNKASFSDILSASAFSTGLSTAAERDTFNLAESIRASSNLFLGDDYKQALADINSAYIAKSGEIKRSFIDKKLRLSSEKETAIALAASKGINTDVVMQAAKVAGDRVTRDTKYTRKILASELERGKRNAYSSYRRSYLQQTATKPSLLRNLLGAGLSAYAFGIQGGLVKNPLD